MKFIVILLLFTEVSYGNCFILQAELTRLLNAPSNSTVLKNSEDIEFAFMLTKEPYVDALTKKLTQLNEQVYMNTSEIKSFYNTNLDKEFATYISKQSKPYNINSKEINDAFSLIAEKQYYLALQKGYVDAGLTRQFNDKYLDILNELNNPSITKKRNSKIKAIVSNKSKSKNINIDLTYDKNHLKFNEQGDIFIDGVKIRKGTPSYLKSMLTDKLKSHYGAASKARTDLADEVYNLLDIDPYDIALTYQKRYGQNMSVEELYGFLNDYTSFVKNKILNISKRFPPQSFEKNALTNLASNIELRDRNIRDIEKMFTSSYSTADDLSINGFSKNNNSIEVKKLVSKIQANLVGFRQEFYIGMNISSAEKLNYIAPVLNKEIDVVIELKDGKKAWAEIKSGILSTDSPGWLETYSQYQRMLDAIAKSPTQAVTEIHYITKNSTSGARMQMQNEIKIKFAHLLPEQRPVIKFINTN